MKDNKEDDTVRYKNTLESYENSISNISEEKILKAITKEENKNIIDKLYDCGDELSNEDINSQLNNYYLNEINKNGDKDDNNSKRERYNINMFNFIENDDCTDNKISLNNGTEDKEQQINTSKEIIETNGGNEIEALDLNYGDVYFMPDDPTKDGYIFDGWYIEPSYKTRVDEDYIVNGDLKIFAKFITKDTNCSLEDGNEYIIVVMQDMEERTTSKLVVNKKTGDISTYYFE